MGKRRAFIFLSILLLITMLISTTTFAGAENKQSGPVKGENPDKPRVGMYDVYEISYTLEDGTALDNAEKSSLDFHAVFTHGNTTITIPGFWAGGCTWKLRFSPTRLGDWKWETSSTKTGLNGIAGELKCTASEKKGFVKVDDTNPYAFAYTDGTPVYIWGNTAYMMLATELHDNGTNGFSNVWKNYVDNSLSKGINKVRLLATMWNWGDFSNTNLLFPWENCTKAAPNFASFNQSYWEGLDRIVKYSEEKGMMIEIILFADYGLPGSAATDPGLLNMTAEDERRLERFAAARYAAYPNVTWCVGNEWNAFADAFRSRYPDNANSAYTVPPSWVQDNGNYLYSVDPYARIYGRLSTIHSINSTGFGFSAEPWVTHAVLQNSGGNKELFTKIHDWNNAGSINNRQLRMPVINDEYGYAGAAIPAKSGGGTLTRQRMRMSEWSIAVGGGYGSFGDAKVNTVPGLGNNNFNDGVWADIPDYDDLKVMLDFMREGNRFYYLSPANELVTARPSNTYTYMAAHSGYEYIMYAVGGGSAGGSFTISLKPGDYTAQWLDTTSGTPVAVDGEFTVGEEGSKSFICPDFTANGDIVLLVAGTKAYDPEADASLRDLVVGGVTIPGFDPGIADYSFVLPASATEAPTVSAFKYAPQAEMKIAQASSATGSAVVTVTSASGSKINYTINFSKASEISWPLRVSANKRYLEDQDGKAIFIYADVARQLPAYATGEEITRYLDDRMSRGFNSVVCSLIDPANIDTVSKAAGVKAFSDNANLTPNEDYFANIDRIADQAAARGMQLIINPMLVDDAGMGSRYTAANSLSYGQYLGDRYKNKTNIIWYLLGDVTATTANTNITKANALAEGIKTGENGGSMHLISAMLNNLPANNTATVISSSDLASVPVWLDFYMIKTMAPALAANSSTMINFNSYSKVASDYGKPTTKPTIIIEGNPEMFRFEGVGKASDNNKAILLNPQSVRSGAAMSFLSGGCGISYAAWPMYDMKRFTNWESYQNLAGVLQTQYLMKLFTSHRWEKLIPDSTLITAGLGSATGTFDYVTASVASDGTFAMAYLPRSKSITVDLSKLTGGTSINARWYDPTDGKYIAIGEYTAAGTQVFTAPPVNSAGQGDFILVLEARP